MSDTFNFKRFCNYFRFDLSRIWRRHGKTALMLGGASVILYFVWAILGLVFTLEWCSAPTLARVVGFFLVLIAFEFFMIFLYGHVTDRKAGPDFILLPASTLEKYISLMLNVLLVVPLLFTGMYLACDYLICLIDPACGMPLITGAVTSLQKAYDGVIMMNEMMAQEQIPVHYSIMGMILPLVSQVIFNLLFYVFCGILFKRLKLLWTLLVSWGFGMIISMGAGLLMPFMIDVMDTEEGAMRFAGGLMDWSAVFNFALAAGLAVAIFLRLKKMTH